MSVTPSAAPTPLFIEERFPLDLNCTIAPIRALYEAGKQARWDPYRDIAWDGFSTASYEATALDAARHAWSRRAWIEYTGLAETPALLVRFCLERGREADPKLFLSVQNTEEAWHIECLYRFAGLLGGYVDRPRNGAGEALFNGARHREALSAETCLDAYVAAHCAFEHDLDVALYDAANTNATEPLARDILGRVAADKHRHAAFGWAYLEERAPGWDDPVREAVASAVMRVLGDQELQGYRFPTLGGTELAEDAGDEEVTADAGLGGVAAPEARACVAGVVSNGRGRLAALGVELPMFRHEALGEL